MSDNNGSPPSKRRCFDLSREDANMDSTTSASSSGQSEPAHAHETPHTSESGPSQIRDTSQPAPDSSVQVTDQRPLGPALDAQVEDGSVYLEHIAHHQRDLPRFNTARHTHHFRFMNLDRIQSFPDALRAMRSAIQTLLDKSLAEVKPGDFMQLKLDGGNTLDHVFSTKQTREKFNAEIFLNNIANALQSNVDCLSSNCLKLTVMVIRNKRGGGRKQLKEIMYSQIIKQKKQYLYDFTYGTTTMCLAASLCALLGTTGDSLILEKAKQLHKDLGIPENEEVPFSDIEAFEKNLDATINILYWNEDRWRFYNTESPSRKRSLYILHHGNHYYGIKNVRGFLGKQYFCERCNSVYHHKNQHNCPYFCRACQQEDCVEDNGALLRCQRCRVFCRSEQCLEEHRRLAATDGSLCEEKTFCKGCQRYQKNISTHTCRGKRCEVCCADMDNSNGHVCYMQKYKPPKHTDKYIVYDFECMQETGTHIPNYIYAKELCGQEDWEFQGTTCVQDFTKHFIKKKFSGYTFIAHNAGRYDSYFIIQELIKEKLEIKVVNQGGRFLEVTLVSLHIRFIDSLNFLPMKLSKLPQAMGFQKSKGFFPHLFNTAENQNYVGPMVGQVFYGVDFMMPSEKDEFMTWYEEHKQDEFDFQKELKEYCRLDVDVLREACQTYRDGIMKMTTEGVKRDGNDSECIDPFQHMTLASVCMAMYKFTCLPPDTIAIVPGDNYHKGKKRFSTPAIQWLMYTAHKEEINIKHALNGGEKQVGNYFLDGYAVGDVKDTAFEFLGCYYHGCPVCYKDENESTKYKHRYQQFLAKKRYLQACDFEVRVLWEHEWNKMLEEDAGLLQFISERQLPQALDPRDALYGGRTNAIRLYHKAEKDETISYYDFTSLYPFVNKTKTYPKGHPEIIYKEFGSIDQYFGIAKVKVYPPRELFFPVLPVKIDKKLLFPLCYTCASTSQSDHCNHNDEERSLTGTWCTMELQLAVEKGYTIEKIYEVWHFPETTTELFAPYIKQHLQYKQEASGYPSWCTDEAKKKQYIDSYYEREGVQLRPEDIKENPAKRQISKLFLNSLWGKFGQRSNLPQTSIVTNPDKLFKLAFTPCYEISEVNFINDDTAIVNWKYSKAHHMVNRNTNIFIACFTTAYARLELYKLLDGLKERCFYHDTDSVIFVSKDGDWNPPLGDYLGELTSEVPDGAHITEFVSAGPKTYGYKLSNGKTVLKVKGITLNVASMQDVNFESLKELVLDYPHNSDPLTQQSLGVQQSGIVKNQKSLQIETRVLSKTLKCVYTKRQLASDFTTLPFGY